MVYKRNEQMEFLETEDGRMVVFDPATGDTHFLDETGRTIMDLLSKPSEEAALVRDLMTCYETEEDTIAADVRTFLSELQEKDVVLEAEIAEG